MNRKALTTVGVVMAAAAVACSSCHEVYRDVGPADSPARCTPPGRRSP